MPTTIGAHLLGRLPSPADERNWPLGFFLDRDGSSTPIRAALAALQASHAARATKAWAAVVTDLLDPPVPPAPLPPAPAVQRWPNAEPVLDQGDTPRCVGFGWAQFGNSDPIDDHYANADGDAIYAECKIIDHDAADGSTVHAGARAMRDRQRIDGYAWAANVDEITAWVLRHGPVVVGTEWQADMFAPDESGFVRASGDIVGGHCYVCCGWDPTNESNILTFQNSWGAGWGDRGYFYMHVDDFTALFGRGGEGCTAVELA